MTVLTVVPFVVWALIVLVGVTVVLVVVAFHGAQEDLERRDRIAAAHQDWRGTRAAGLHGSAGVHRNRVRRPPASRTDGASRTAHGRPRPGRTFH